MIVALDGVGNIERLDFSINYPPVKQVTPTFDVSNLLAKPFNNYRRYGAGLSYPRDIRDEGWYFGLGARFRF